MNPLIAVILGLVEGITEYLPVSSTGHLILASALLGLDDPPERKHAVDAFNIVIQGGAILAVLGLYRGRVLEMIRGLLGRSAPGRKLFLNIFVAFLPAAIFGVLLDDLIERYLFYPGPVIGALIVGGIVMIAIGPWQRRVRAREDHGGLLEDLEHLPLRSALAIGLIQCLAMWPGTSRSMVTIVGGMVVGLRPKHAAEFSFLLGLPTLGGACVYKLMKNMAGDGANLFDTLGVSSILIGLAVATVSAALAVKWLVTYLNRHGLSVFGWYRLALSAVLIVFIARGALKIAPEVVEEAPAAELGAPVS